MAWPPTWYHWYLRCICLCDELLGFSDIALTTGTIDLDMRNLPPHASGLVDVAQATRWLGINSSPRDHSSLVGAVEQSSSCCSLLDGGPMHGLLSVTFLQFSVDSTSALVIRTLIRSTAWCISGLSNASLISFHESGLSICEA